LPEVRVSSEFVIEIGAKYGSSVDIDPENIDELIEVLKHAKAWAKVCRCSYPRPPRLVQMPLPVTEPDSADSLEPL